jgi:hypothetical protein
MRLLTRSLAPRYERVSQRCGRSQEGVPRQQVEAHRQREPRAAITPAGRSSASPRIFRLSSIPWRPRSRSCFQTGSAFAAASCCSKPRLSLSSLETIHRGDRDGRCPSWVEAQRVPDVFPQPFHVYSPAHPTKLPAGSRECDAGRDFLSGAIQAGFIFPSARFRRRRGSGL